jgi:phosphatidylinositol glycan class U
MISLQKVLLMLFAISLGSFMILSYQLMGSWDWIYASYGFTLQVIDLTPNIGLFWYFFLEVKNICCSSAKSQWLV